MPSTLPGTADSTQESGPAPRRGHTVAVTHADQPWPAPPATGRLAAVVELPGSKSLTNRALVLAALSHTPTRLTAPLAARDTALMVGALTALGVRVSADGEDWVVQ